MLSKAFCVFVTLYLCAFTAQAAPRNSKSSSAVQAAKVTAASATATSTANVANANNKGKKNISNGNSTASSSAASAPVTASAVATSTANANTGGGGKGKGNGGSSASSSAEIAPATASAVAASTANANNGGGGGGKKAKAKGNGGSSASSSAASDSATASAVATSTANAPIGNGGSSASSSAASVSATTSASVGGAVSAIASVSMSASASSVVATSTSASAAAASSVVASTNGTATPDNPDIQNSLTLDPSQINSGFLQNGQAVPEAGQVASLTSGNNFINFCAGKTLTNGQQVTQGSCNPAIMGEIVAQSQMPSCKFTFPTNFGTIQANTAFTVSMAIQNMETGNFVNAQQNYFAAPQQLDAQGLIKGHSHIVIELLDSLTQTTPTDPQKFAFFKGLNAPAAGGILTADVSAGLPSGVYRLFSITTASNHQPVLLPVAQHGSPEDAIYFTVTADGNPVGNSTTNSASGAAAASSSAAGAGASQSAAATATTNGAAASATATAKGKKNKRGRSLAYYW